MSEYIMRLQQAMKQQSSDLQDELDELKTWQSSVAQQSAAVKKKHENQKSAMFADKPGIPPVRYTAAAAAAGASASTAAAGAPSKSQRTDADVVTECKDRGNAYFSRGQYDDAVRAYTQGLDADPTSTVCHTLFANRSLCNIKLQKWDAAEKDATQAIGLNRTNAKAFYRRGVARRNLGDLSGAKADLDTCQVLAPGDSDSLKELLVVNAQLVERAKAENKGGAAATASATASAPTKKKIVIEEVSDDDDDTAVARGPASSAAAAATATATAGPSAAEQRARDEALRRDMAAAEERQAADRREKAAKEEAARQRQRKSNSRVEVVDEVEDDDATASPAVAKTAATSVSSSKNASPSPSRAAAAAAPAAAASSGATSSSSSRQASSSQARGAASQPAVAPRTVNVKIFTRDNMPTPQTFSDVESIYCEVRTEPELLAVLVTKLATGREPADIATLFGCNLTSEMLANFVGAAAAADVVTDDVAARLMQGLALVRRIEDLVMFQDDADAAQVKVAVARCSGLSAQQKAALIKKLAS